MLRLATIGIIVILATVSCGADVDPGLTGSVGTDAEASSTSVGESPEPDSSADDASRSATTRYGYLEVTLRSIEITNEPPEDLDLREPLAADEAAVIVDLSIDNLTVESGWTFDHGYLFWLKVGDELYSEVSRQRVELEPAKTADATLAFAVPSHVDASRMLLWIQEGALDPDNRRRPAWISSDGEVDEPFDELVTTTFSEPRAEYGCNSDYVWTKWVLDDNAGFKENGAQLWDVDRRAVSLLGRASEKSLLLTTHATATRDTNTCALQVHGVTPTVRIGDALRDYISRLGTRVSDWSAEPTEDINTFEVSEELREFVVEMPERSFANAYAFSTTGTF